MPDNKDGPDFQMELTADAVGPPKPDTAMHRAVVIASAAGTAAGEAASKVNSLGISELFARYANAGLMGLVTVLFVWFINENSRIAKENRDDARERDRSHQQRLEQMVIKLETLNILMQNMAARNDPPPLPREK